MNDAAAIRSEYDELGYVIFRDVLSPDVIAAANRHVDWLLTEHPELQPDELSHDLARTDPFWHWLISRPELLDIASTFLGPNVALFATHYICKAAGVGRPVAWHHDAGYWPLEPMEVITAWVALTHSDAENGALKVVPGSHKWELTEMVPTKLDAVLPLEVPVDVDESDAVTLELNPGDVSVHHPNLVHGSDPNRSTRWRRGLTIRYIPTTTRILEPDRATPFMLRGGDELGVDYYLRTPSKLIVRQPDFLQESSS